MTASIPEVPDGLDAAFDTLSRAQASGDIEVLNEAIDALSRIRAEIPADHPSRYRLLANLAQGLRQRFDLRGDRNDLDAALVAAESALRLMPSGHLQHPIVLTSLSVLKQTSYIHYGEQLEDRGVALLADAEELAETAVDETDQADPRWAGRVHALAAAQRLRYEATGSPEHLAHAIDTARKAYTAAGQDRPYLVSHLALTLRMRYESKGSLSDLNEAIDIGRRAARSNDPIHSPMTWGNLSTMLEARYAHFGGSFDLDEAITWARRAAEETQPQYTYHAMFNAMLANALRIRGAARKNAQDLDEAVNAAERAIEHTPNISPATARRLAILTAALLARSELDARPQDIDRAVEAGRRAVRAAVQTGYLATGVLFTAASALRRRFDRRHERADGEEAIRYATEALAVADPNDPDRARIHLNLGDWQADDNATAAGQYRAAAESFTAAPSIRCLAARGWGRAMMVAGQPAQASHAYGYAVELLPRVASRALVRADQERQLARQTGLAGDAAAAALVDQDANRALILLEHGRAILTAQTLETRSDLTELRSSRPDLAQRLAELAAQIDSVRTVEP